MIILLIFPLIVLPGCSGNKKADGAPVKESPVTVTEETIQEETAGEATGTDENDTTITEDTSGQETVSSETETGPDESILIFKGNRVNENTATMVLEVNMETGDIAGVIQMGFKGFDMNMNSTQLCDYVLTGNISGKVDPATLKIKGVLKGRAETDTDTQGCKDYNVDYEMVADMSEDSSIIKGYFDTKTMDEYEFFLKKVIE